MGVADWPVTGRRRGRSQHYCGGLDCGLPWWRSGNITRTQNVSKYMLVLALCLVITVIVCLCPVHQSWTWVTFLNHQLNPKCLHRNQANAAKLLPDPNKPIVNTRSFKNLADSRPTCRTKTKHLLHIVSKTGLTIKC